MAGEDGSRKKKGDQRKKEDVFQKGEIEGDPVGGIRMSRWCTEKGE